MTHRLSVSLLASVLFALIFAGSTRAQARLTETDRQTTVSKISFKFGTTQTFEKWRLMDQIATTEPGFLDAPKKLLDFLPFISVEKHGLGPIELQRDVVRLRNFYAAQGFLHTQINYFASQYNRDKNSVHIIFSVQEGPPLIVMSVDIEGTDSLPEDVDTRWKRQRAGLFFADSSRYSTTASLKIENDVVTFFQNSGYPFTRIHTENKIDSTANIVLAQYRIETGSRARIEDILIEGNVSVGDRIVTRELPLKKGDYFSRKKLSQGQSDLFGMNLFRFAIAELPEQPQDSSVVIRYKLGEANKRSLTVAGGFSGEFGLTGEASVIHRNFLGGARSATISGIAETGWYANPGNGKTARRSFKVSLSVRQPFVLKRGLSATLAPFYNRLDDPNQNTDYYSYGATGMLLFRMLVYRTATLEYTYDRNVPLTGRGTDEPFDLYDTSAYAVGLTFGKLDDYLNPVRGYMLHPRFEAAGTIFDSGVNYRKGVLSGRVFAPVSKRSSFALMLSYGLMVPFGESADQNDPETEYRFDGIRFYAGGSNDVRGWGLNELGPQLAVGDSIVVDDAGIYSVQNPLYEAVGGRAKLTGSVEYRFPIALMPEAVRLGIFIDFGVLSARFTEDGQRTAVVGIDQTVEDTGSLIGADFQFGTGAGIRYATPVGSVRFDVAYKLTPSYTDLRNPEDIILYESGLTDTEPKAYNGRRWRLHLSLDRSF